MPKFSALSDKPGVEYLAGKAAGLVGEYLEKEGVRRERVSGGLDRLVGGLVPQGGGVEAHYTISEISPDPT